MDVIVDDQGVELFSDKHEHRQLIYQDFDGAKTVDFVVTSGNIWFPATQVMDVMGMNAAETKNTSRVLNRLDHPDIIKIRNTPFRFNDGRRNRGAFISPRAVMVFNTGKTKGYHPIKSCAFIEWMQEQILEGHDEDYWSPSKKEVKSLEPTFHKAKHEASQDDPELDPLRPVGRYLPMVSMPPLEPDEVEFCLCQDERNGLGKCWCKRRGGIKTYTQQQFERAGVPDCVIDEDDVFEVITEVVTTARVKTVPVEQAQAST